MSGNSFESKCTVHDDALERNSSKSKRTAEDYAVDATIISGNSSKSRRTVEDYPLDDRLREMAISIFRDPKNQKRLPPGMSEEEFIRSLSIFTAYKKGGLIDHDDERYMQRRARYSPDDNFYIDAAFRSSRDNEVFMFTGYEYFVVKYDCDSREVENVTKARLLLIDGFPGLYHTRFHTAGVDAAFGCHGTDEAFLFSGSLTAKIKYDDNNEGRVVELEGMPGLFMFPCLKDTKFSVGYFDAACESTVPDEAYIFKGSDYALINYSKLTLISKGRITEEFTCLRNTIFACEIGSAFASHSLNQLYFFKDNTYVLIRFDSKTKKSNIIAGPEEIAPTNWPCLEGLVPYKKDKNPDFIEPKKWKPVFDGENFVPASDKVSLEYPPAPFDEVSPLANLCRRICDYGPGSST